MFRPNIGHHQVSSWKAVLGKCYRIMQRRIGRWWAQHQCAFA